MKKPANITSVCPFCKGMFHITQLSCEECDTRVETDLPIPDYFRLPEELQDFVIIFLRCRGNIREVEKAINASYPTVCKKLDLVNHLLGNSQRAVDPREILERVERGELTAAEAVQLLKEE